MNKFFKCYLRVLKAHNKMLAIGCLFNWFLFGVTGTLRWQDLFITPALFSFGVVLSELVSGFYEEHTCPKHVWIYTMSGSNRRCSNCGKYEIRVHRED